jgi:c-di-GMP-binding flagellar brake protein YcgR
MDGFQELDEDKLYRSLREYARVSAFLPIRIRPVLEEERQSLRSRIVVESALTEHRDMPEIEDEVLSACLQILNSKLDSIIRLLASPSNNHGLLDFTRVNISAGGLSTSSSECYALDDLVEIRLMLPGAPFTVLYVYGKVVGCEVTDEKFGLCIEFTEIDDDIRDQIEKYVFHKQREILRKKRSRTV